MKIFLFQKDVFAMFEYLEKVKFVITTLFQTRPSIMYKIVNFLLDDSGLTNDMGGEFRQLLVNVVPDVWIGHLRPFTLCAYFVFWQFTRYLHIIRFLFRDAMHVSFVYKYVMFYKCTRIDAAIITLLKVTQNAITGREAK